MGDIKSKYFQGELEKLLDKYGILGSFFELTDKEQCLCCICADSEGINIKLNDGVIDQNEFKKVVATLYNNYCK